MLGTVWSLIRAFRWRTTPIVACYGHMNRLIHVGWPGVLNGIFPFMQKTAGEVLTSEGIGHGDMTVTSN